MTIEKESLYFNHYFFEAEHHWVEDQSFPSRRNFDRNNGYHVLRLANWCRIQRGCFLMEDMIWLETLLMEKLPLIKMSERSVCDWLNIKWQGGEE